ncbi:intraflagellar transport protein 88 homolog isoform X2 [Neoarius graeffei]|nr:intraflagellar transport protein 88 homolog isoform X2 [Neoarius graeffei]XP_060785594.1 intraflagellar transport protein 88 homolog isoform X2 [Neoarius graeffei]XP_060785595.1 intraflagellar transport protein 88 homolog isoform X2 [Neoarius graeffei]XP_060785596.1 intraflagellar transport protein 88 homolog isoform X2 [Neoarius graeffei]XP_060785597.1 intraflagellar transport protein 88 homolog isoform X2 [Neoarius graeffei]XP_060785598.1 intraflagellar transport protein 88 homolog isofor
MMENVHLVAEDEDDLYSGYNDYNPTFNSDELDNDIAFQQAVRTSHGRRPPMTAKVPGNAVGGRPIGTSFGLRTTMGSSTGRPMTGAVQDGAARPMTAVRAAGYSSSVIRGSTFDPLGQSRGPAPPLEGKNEDTPEEKIKILEKKVNDLIEESCMAHANSDLQLALEKAKEAGRKERVLLRQREQTGTADHINLDLTYSALFNLANQYANNDMNTEALNTYQVIVKNKMFNNAGRLKVNMANIYFKQKNYPMAIKFYRMALDQISNAHTEMRIKIMQNIGIAFVRMGQYSDAITSFEHIMSESPNIKTGFNLILCYYAIGDRKMMKKSFQKLICVPLGIDEEEKYIPSNDDPHANLLIEAIKNDQLHQMERERKALAEKYIMTSAKLIAPAIESTFAAGFDWCVDMVKGSQYVELANDLEINKAITYLRQRNFNQAVDTLKAFEKKDSRVKSAAATNLSFLYFLEKDFDQADRYAELAMNADRYNPAALINKGNTVFVKQDYEKAAEFYKEALRNDSSCTEALYNLGLTYKKLGRLEEALDCFLKLHAILRNSAQVMYQLASLYEMLEDPHQAIEWLMQLISVTPTDPHVLAKLGELYDNEGDKSQAFQYYYESFRYFPSNIHVIEWLGAYYIDTQFCEKAIQYFERATLIQPNRVVWQLMVASCYRRSGNYQRALETYKDIHRKFPENAECLRFLVRLCTDMGLKEVQDYATKLKKVEKMKEIREQRVKSGRENSARGRREGSASSDSGQSSHGASAKGERLGVKLRSLPGPHEPYEASTPGDIDASYVDPLGPQTERPKTAAKKRAEEDEFADEELGDDLLPE